MLSKTILPLLLSVHRAWIEIGHVGAQNLILDLGIRQTVYIAPLSIMPQPQDLFILLLFSGLLWLKKYFDGARISISGVQLGLTVPFVPIPIKSPHIQPI
jgi:hypothetical protein